MRRLAGRHGRAPANRHCAQIVARWSAARLAPWKIPAHILPLAELPITERGKTDRRAVGEVLAGKPR